jgi:hypothetical protein
MHRAFSTLIVLTLVLVACGGTATTTTDPASPVTTGGEADEGTTTAATEITTTTLTQTTTTLQVPVVDADLIVERKTTALESVIPEDWTFETGRPDDFNEADDLFYELCLLPGEFDLDNLDEVTDAALVTMFEGPSATPPFPGQRGSIEARVFQSETLAAEAFAVFERVFGTEEGLQCMTTAVQDLAGDDAPIEDLTLSFEELTVAGSQAGARFEMSFDVSGFVAGIFVEFQGARSGSTTVIASFITFGEPFDRETADTLFDTAVTA